jgi:hypothetical protein
MGSFGPSVLIKVKINFNTCDELACAFYLCFPNYLIYAHVMLLGNINSRCQFLFLNFKL